MSAAEAPAVRPASPGLLVAWGNVLFRTRDAVFTAALLLVFLFTKPVWPGGSERWDDFVDVAGLLIALAGQAIRVAVIGTVYVIRGGRNRKVYAEELVTGGFFAHCRNPLYLGNLLVLLGLLTIWHAPVAWLVAAPFFLLGYVAIVAAEEAFLRGKFGAAFDDYCARVPRWIPRFRGLRASLEGTRFHLRRVVIKEYGSTAAWMLAACALLLGDSLSRQPWGARPAYHAAVAGAMPGVVLLWGVARWLKKTKRLRDD